MFFFILFLIAASLTGYFYFQWQSLRQLREQDRQGIAGQLREIARLQSEILALQNEILALQTQLGETTGRLSEVQGTAASYRERLERLAKYENLGKLVALDEELVRLRQAEKEYRAKINEHITSANLRAQRIIEEANQRAEQIAGDAVSVARDFRQYEQAVKAMRNIIDGYGNQYIIPGQSLLDELAQLYGHTEAGRELKRAREHMKLMVVNGTAAVCDYVETSRKETAVTFVVDAFNGKVDSVLSRCKRDNYGKLRQEILDAFTIVNLNGRAFRNARITEEYLNARLDELKWACAAQEVRMRQMEEQRRLREQMREEEKARREYERAIKEAAKEENLVRKAMETAQRQLAEASEEQRAQYEAKLHDLQEKLRAAEEKNKRAMSMAQQTKSGHVYIISNIGSFGDGIYKIGMTRRLEPMDRVKELGDASVPFDFDIHALIQSDDAPGLETMLHKYFLLNRVNKVNHRREFFRASVEEIKQQVDTLGLQTQWTMAAEARQYYETQVIEKAIAENPEARKAWLRSQAMFEEEEWQEMLAGKDTDEMGDLGN